MKTHRKTILRYNLVTDLYGNYFLLCSLPECEEQGRHSIIQLDSEIILCDKHLKQWYDEALEIADRIQEILKPTEATQEKFVYDDGLLRNP